MTDDETQSKCPHCGAGVIAFYRPITLGEDMQATIDFFGCPSCGERTFTQ